MSRQGFTLYMSHNRFALSFILPSISTSQLRDFGTLTLIKGLDVSSHDTHNLTIECMLINSFTVCNNYVSWWGWRILRL